MKVRLVRNARNARNFLQDVSCKIYHTTEKNTQTTGLFRKGNSRNFKMVSMKKKEVQKPMMMEITPEFLAVFGLILFLYGMGAFLWGYYCGKNSQKKIEEK